jgi:hypothetical protein
MNNLKGLAIWCAGWFLACTATNICIADSAVSLLSGFDAARLEAVYPPRDADAAGELAKLVYRLRAIDPNALDARVGNTAGYQLGDAIRIDGEIQEIKVLKVPSRLVEFVELSYLHLIVVDTGTAAVRVATAMLPRDAKRTDRVSGIGVVIETSAADDSEHDLQPAAIATARLRWFPQTSKTAGWQLLGDEGLDVSLLAEVAARNRRPLLAEDGDAFYSMLAAAATISRRDDLPTPSLADPVMLLREPENLGGQWLRMNLETVQVTRITVAEPHRQAQLGSDHYFQIDAVGDLGNTVVKMERAAGDEGPPAIFANRYPVSVVIRELPEFLSQRIRGQEGGDAIVSNIKVMVGVDVFFYRLWSYSTDFMSQHGGLDQFGPLLVGARIRNREPTSNDPVGSSAIGWIAAIAVISAIVATWYWNRRISAHDLEIRQRRKASDAEQLQLPQL